MQKILLSAAILAVSAFPAPACYFGAALCYFSDDVGAVQETELGELWLVGRHFFPEWAGKAPRGNDIGSAEAHAMDFGTAAARAGAADPRGDFERYRATANRWEEAAREGGNLFPLFHPGPEEERAAWPDYAKQFYLYSLGRAQLLLDPTLSAPPAWEELLALPEADRRERTVWVLHGKVLAAKDFAAADEQLRALRAACDAGFADTCGLEAAVLRRLLLRDPDLGLRWLPLLLAAYGEMPSSRGGDKFNVHKLLPNPYVEGLADRETALVKRAANEFAVWRRPSWRENNERMLSALPDDPVGREILFILDGGTDAPVPPETELATPLLSADRAAFRAFQRGDLEAAKALLARAPEDSLMRLFLEARFARMDGDAALAAEKLRRWLAVYRERGAADFCDFAVGAGKYWDYCDEPWHTVSWPEYVAGTLGTICVEQSDFVEALGVFVRDANSWIDAAFVAERCLPLGTLAECLPDLEASMASAEGGMAQAGRLERLLARRLMRNGEPQAAGAWFARAVEEAQKAFDALPEGKRDRGLIYGEELDRAEKALALWQVRQAVAKRAYAETDPDKRAAAFVDLARLERSAGLELYATELEPDVGVQDGDYDNSGFAFGAVAGPPVSLSWLEWCLRPERIPKTRWHWRGRAAKTARRAAAMAASEGVKAGALLLAGGFPYADAYLANDAFEMLSDLPTHPAGEYAREKHWIPNWGCGPVADLIDEDNARSPEAWLAGGWESTPESLVALAEAAGKPTGESALDRWYRRRYGCSFDEWPASDRGSASAGAETDGGTEGECEPLSYIVQLGDTVASLASVFVVSGDDLRALNGLGGDEELSPGQSILIPPPRNP